MKELQGRGEGNPLAVDALVAETARGFDSKANWPRRLERFSKAKERTLLMCDFITSDPVHKDFFKKEAEELRHCGSWMMFHDYYLLGKVRLAMTRSCRQHLLCPLCAIRRGSRALSVYLKRVELVLKENPSVELHMVTFTVKNGPDLAERIKHLVDSVKASNKRRHLGRGSEFEKCLGSFWSYEVKRGGGSGLWHPHVHCVWICSKDAPPDAVALSHEWHSITGDSFIIETHPLYGDLAAAFCEVLKYALKFSDMPLSDNLDAYELLRGRRLIASNGLLWGVEIPEAMEDEIDEFSEGAAFAELFVRYFPGGGYLSPGSVDHVASNYLEVA